MAIGWSLGQAIRSENRRSRTVRPGRPGRRRRTRRAARPPARLSAVSTESVSRRFAPAAVAGPLATSRSTTTSMVCLSFFSSSGGSASDTTSPSTRARENPLVCSSAKRSTYSPLRPLTTGASTWNRVRSGSSSSRSTICWGLWRVIASPHTGQCGPAGAGEQQPEVVVDLGDRADRGPRVAVRRLLVDRDGRRQALDEVDVGLVHLAEELTRVRAERLDVAPLTLGEDRVEGQRGLAAAREAGEADQRVTRQLDRDVLEVVLASAAHDEVVVSQGTERGVLRRGSKG